MSHSKLTDSVVHANSTNYTSGRRGYKICKITPHHMAGHLTGTQCARIFQNSGRNASANYCIGYNGDIVCSVEEENRAWTSSSSWNDCQAITIEVANSKTGGDWPISDASWKSLVNLCADICKRYGFRLNYTGDKNGSLTRHNMYANTNCPGPYLQARLGQLAKEVNAKLDGKTPSKEEKGNGSTKGTEYKVTATALNVRKGPSTNYNVIKVLSAGTKVTVYEEKSGWGRIANGQWVSMSYLKKSGNSSSSSSSSSKNKFVLGLYQTTAALNVRSGAGTNYKIKKTYAKGTRFDTYQISGDWAKTPSGWVNLNYAKLIRKY